MASEWQMVIDVLQSLAIILLSGALYYAAR